MDKLEVVKFESGVEGPDLLITGAIHGYEVCGTVATRRWIERLEKGAFKILKGSLTILPVCSPKSQGQGVRFIDVNLNRVIKMHDNPTAYEHHMANQIFPHLQAASHVLDLHSYIADDIPFVFCEKETREVFEFVDMAAVPHMILGFDQLLADMDLLDAYHSVENTAIHMGKVACTLECGQNGSKLSIETADSSIGNVLQGLGMIEGYQKNDIQKGYYRATDVVYKGEEGSHVKPWKNFEAVKKGDLIAQYDSGQEFRAKEDGVIFLPRDKEIGSEWYHMAVETEFNI
tara:strand:+ start:872 stop:1735 length:864 start_codon:yes stop_codon:yes gene_type:complete